MGNKPFIQADCPKLSEDIKFSDGENTSSTFPLNALLALILKI